MILENRDFNRVNKLEVNQVWGSFENNKFIEHFKIMWRDNNIIIIRKPENSIPYGRSEEEVVISIVELQIIILEQDYELQ